MRRILVIAAAAVALSAGAASAAPLDVYFNNFDGTVTLGGGATGGLSGETSTTPVGGFAGLGIGGNTFSGNLLWNTATGNPALATTLTLNNLPVHDSISLSFLLAIIDSWDSDNGPGGVAPDYLFIKVDGVQLFQGTWANGSGSDNTTIGTDIGSGAQQRFNNGTFPDRAYDATGDGTITDIAHTASTLAIQWFAGGAGWQGGSDENFGLDNLRITVNTAADALPEPITLGLFGFGLASLGLARRRRS